MIPRFDPFTRWVGLGSGLIEPEADVAERRLADMAGYYLDGADETDRLVYRVLAVPVEETNSELQCSTTIVEPGTVGDEFHMTKGHFHVRRDRSEIYLGLAGEGILLLATEDGRHREEPIGPGSLSYVPGGWAHRSINTGLEPLVFFAVYVGDAGHDYETIEGAGFPVVVVRGAGNRPEVRSNPRYEG